MAVIEMMDGDAFGLSLSKLGKHTGAICEKALRAGGGVAADAVRANLKERQSPRATGEMLGSLGITPVKYSTQKRTYNVHIGFDGYDSRGTPNQWKARIFEKRKPFVRPALLSARERAQKIMRETAEKEINQIMS